MIFLLNQEAWLSVFFHRRDAEIPQRSAEFFSAFPPRSLCVSAVKELFLFGFATLLNQFVISPRSF